MPKVVKSQAVCTKAKSMHWKVANAYLSVKSAVTKQEANTDLAEVVYARVVKDIQHGNKNPQTGIFIYIDCMKFRV